MEELWSSEDHRAPLESEWRPTPSTALTTISLRVPQKHQMAPHSSWQPHDPTLLPEHLGAIVRKWERTQCRQLRERGRKRGSLACSVHRRQKAKCHSSRPGWRGWSSHASCGSALPTKSRKQFVQQQACWHLCSKHPLSPGPLLHLVSFSLDQIPPDVGFLT